MPYCPICSYKIQTPDLPCPSCSSESVTTEFDASAVGEFSETLHYGRIMRYRPQEFVDQVNRWLMAHPGIVGIGAVLHRDREGVRSITFTCLATLEPSPMRVQVACLPLRTSWGSRLYADPGRALSVWADRNHRARRLNHWIYDASGNASEVWVLFVVPEEDVELPNLMDTPSPGRPRRRYLSTSIAVVNALLFLFIPFLILGFVITLLAPTDSSSRAVNVTVVAAVTAVLIGLAACLRRFHRSPFRQEPSSPPG